ncbi:MAG: putative esterase [Myxococcota bacterium]
MHDPATARAPATLRFEVPGTDTAAALADASTLKVERSLLRDGYRFGIQLPITGSRTAMPKAIPWTATLGRKTIASGILGGPVQSLDVALKRSGTHKLTVRAGGRTWIETFGYHQPNNGHLLDARERLRRAPRDALSQATIDTYDYNLRKFEALVLESIPETKWLAGQCARVAQWGRSLQQGTDPFATQRGDYYRAYRSRYDDNLQYYSVHIPKRYDGEKAWPLVIGMHGIGSGTHYTLRRVLGKDRDKEGGEPGGKPLIRNNMPRLPDHGVLTASAWGYHNSAYWFYGEDDVMRVIEEMKRTYNVDENRIYLTGLSLGGLGTYHIGHHFPDVFAALGPLGGFSSIKLYRQIRNHPKTPWEKRLIEQRDATSYAANGRHTPMRVVHGKFDAPRHATAMTSKYEKYQYKYELEIPELGHDVWQHAYGGGALIKWMKRFRRPAAPDEVVFDSLSYRYTRAYWVELGWMDRYLDPARVKLKVDPKNRSRIVIKRLENLRGLTLDLTRPKLTGEQITLRFPDGATLVVPRKRIHLRREGDGPWALADSAAPPKGHKRPGVSGPLDDIMNDPHVFVVGTGDPLQTEVNRRLVSGDRSYVKHRNHDIWFPVLDDVDVTDADLAGQSLVLYGNPSSNRVLKKVLDTGKVPLSFEPNALVVGGRRYEGADVGVKMIVPNPFAPDKVIVIVAGVTARGTLLSRYLPRFLPDVIVWDSRIDTHYFERILIDRKVLFAGFFNSDWTLPR